jgi:threonine dehydratase
MAIAGRVPLDEIRAAALRIADSAVRSPLLRLPAKGIDELWLKLENLQPIGSFKIRGAGNALAAAPLEALRHGVSTASAGNMARAVAWHARRRGLPCSVLVPEGAPAAKLDPVADLGARIIRVPFDEWWRALEERGHAQLTGHFVHPVADVAVMAGNGTIGLEIVDELADVDVVVVPFGGGGLSCGIASALKALRPQVRVFAAEVATAAPLSAALAAGRPMRIEYERSWVDGIGGGSVLDEMWPVARDLLDGSIVVSLDETAAALRTLVQRGRVVAEGAGAAAVAAALSGRAGAGRVVAVVSGGLIEPSVLSRLMR